MARSGVRLSAVSPENRRQLRAEARAAEQRELRAMVTGIIGKKLGMTQVFGQDGTVTPGTVIKAGPVRRRAGQGDGDRRLRGRAARPRRRAAGAGAQAARRPLQEGRRAADARAPRSDAGGRQRGAEGRRSGARHRRVRERRSRRRHRHQPRQGLPGRHEAPQLPRRRRDARLDVPPRARLDRRLVVPVARRQGHARRPDGWAATASRCAT